MIQATKQPESANSSMASADPAWSCRWCQSHHGVRVLDAGFQPASDLHPQPTDPEPDPEYPLVMVMCLDCRLVQLESDPTTPEEPQGLEPSALVEQAEAAVNRCSGVRVRPTGNPGPRVSEPARRVLGRAVRTSLAHRGFARARRAAG